MRLTLGEISRRGLGTHERNSGLYALYFSMSIVASGFMMRVTLYSWPVLSKEVREEMGM